MGSLTRIGNRHPVTCPPRATLADIVRKMAESDVGSVIVVEGRKPTGIVTDRDLVLRVLHRGEDPKRLRAEDVMTRDIVTVRDELDPLEAAVCMREHRVRRLPVVDEKGFLVGITTLDDLVHHIGRAADELGQVISSFPVPLQGG